MILLAIASVQLGSALAKNLFDALPPPAVAVLRLGFATAILLPGAVHRTRTRGRIHGRGHADRLRWRNVAVAAGLGLALAWMNLSFYEALDRIPLGVAVAVEFLGPLGVAVAGSRRRLDLLWVVLAGVGVFLLSPVGGLSGVGGTAAVFGVGFAALAGAGWAAYILLTAAVGQRFGGTSGLMLATAVGTVATVPLGVVTAGADLLTPRLMLLGAAVALLASVIPYSLELEALRRIPPRVFGLLMSLEPVVAALIGLVVLGEVLDTREWTAVGLVVVACVGATRSPRSS